MIVDDEYVEMITWWWICRDDWLFDSCWYV